MTLTGSQPEVAEFFWIHFELVGTFLNTLRIFWTNLKLLEIFGIGLELFGIWLKSLGIFLFRRNIVEWMGIFVNLKSKFLNYFEFCYVWRKSLNENLWKSLEHFGINWKILELSLKPVNLVKIGMESNCTIVNCWNLGRI